MPTYKDKKAYDRMIRGRTVLLVSQPFFGCLALHLQLIECLDEDVCSTMMVDGKSLWYYPPFVYGLSDKELEGVLAHEVMHCVYKHMTRRGTRHPLRWNWAGDFVINQDIIQAGFTLPGKPISLNAPPGTKGYLLDKQFAGMSTEEVYERLPEPPTIYIFMSGGGKGGGGGGGGKGQGKGQDQQQNQSDDSGGGGGSGGTPSLPKGADWGGCGGVIDAAGGGADGAAEQSEVDREWEANTRLAVGVAKRANAGQLPGYLQRLVRELQKPRISWREKTREFIDTCMKSDYSWQRPSRRGLAAGMTLPGFVPDGLHKLVFVGDTSGSITEHIMSQYLGEVQGAMDEGTADELVVAYCDTRVHDHREYLQGDIVVYDAEGGGGGTDFRPAFEWVIEHHPDANAMIYLTDMLPSSWELPDPGMPVLWAAYLPEEMLENIKPPFGDVIHVASGD